MRTFLLTGPLALPPSPLQKYCEPYALWLRGLMEKSSLPQMSHTFFVSPYK